MAPDIDSLPAPTARSTSTSQNTPAHLHSEPRRSSLSISQPQVAPSPPRDAGLGNETVRDNTGVGTGPGPLRHPRPLTAADLHMQLEKEQEAVVNRLTRELSLLRQQSASVASTTSSASSGLVDHAESNGVALTATPNRPTSRRHRSSSSLSSRTGATGTSVMASTAGIAPPRDASAPYTAARDTLSRQSSVASRRSEASSPSLGPSIIHGDHFPIIQNARSGASFSLSSSTNQPSHPRSHLSATSRTEEATTARAVLEHVQRENEELKKRVRDLEEALSGRGS